MLGDTESDNELEELRVGSLVIEVTLFVVVEEREGVGGGVAVLVRDAEEVTVLELVWESEADEEDVWVAVGGGVRVAVRDEERLRVEDPDDEAVLFEADRLNVGTFVTEVCVCVKLGVRVCVGGGVRDAVREGEPVRVVVCVKEGLERETVRLRVGNFVTEVTVALEVGGGVMLFVVESDGVALHDTVRGGVTVFVGSTAVLCTVIDELVSPVAWV